MGGAANLGGPGLGYYILLGLLAVLCFLSKSGDITGQSREVGNT